MENWSSRAASCDTGDEKIMKGSVLVYWPIQRPTKFKLAVNLQTARALGNMIPPYAVRSRHRSEVFARFRHRSFRAEGPVHLSLICPLPMHCRRAFHDAGGAGNASGLIALESGRMIFSVRRQATCQDKTILDCHAGALGEDPGARMAGIAQADRTSLSRMPAADVHAHVRLVTDRDVNRPIRRLLDSLRQHVKI